MPIPFILNDNLDNILYAVAQKKEKKLELLKRRQQSTVGMSENSRNTAINLSKVTLDAPGRSALEKGLNCALVPNKIQVLNIP